MVDLTTDLSILFGDLAQVGFLNRERVFFHIDFQVGIIHSSKVFLCKWLSFISAAVSNCFMQMCFVFSSSWHSSRAGVRSPTLGSGSQKRGSSTTHPPTQPSPSNPLKLDPNQVQKRGSSTTNQPSLDLKTNPPTTSSITKIDNFPRTLSLYLFFFLPKTMITLKLISEKSIFILITNSPFFIQIWRSTKSPPSSGFSGFFLHFRTFQSPLPPKVGQMW